MQLRRGVSEELAPRPPLLDVEIDVAKTAFVIERMKRVFAPEEIWIVAATVGVLNEDIKREQAFQFSIRDVANPAIRDPRLEIVPKRHRAAILVRCSPPAAAGDRAGLSTR